MLTVVTPTGGRPHAFALCCSYMQAQTYRDPVHWVIVDDCDPAQTISLPRLWTYDVIRPRERWDGKSNTQRLNLSRALSAVGPRANVVIVEDDDYYAPEYLSTVARWLESNEMVGERNAHYYNVAMRRWGLCNNTGHASLSSTAVRGDALKRLREVVVSNDVFIDCLLWKSHIGWLYDSSLVVGIKGLPGRAGIGIGHRPEFGSPDPTGAILRQWVGEANAERYFGMV